jgi:TRAP-type C4-dicarboxylate transport system permease small subunit
MESIKSFLGNPYYLMTAVLAIAAFGFAATAVISLIQERKQKKEETQEEPLEKNIYVNTLLKIKQKKKTIRGAVFVRRLRLVAYIQRTLLVVLLPNGGRKWLKIIRIE